MKNKRIVSKASRFGSYLIDWSIPIIFLLISMFIIFGDKYLEINNYLIFHYQTIESTIYNANQNAFVLMLLFLTPIILINIYLLIKCKQTLGMKIFGIKCVNYNFNEASIYKLAFKYGFVNLLLIGNFVFAKYYISFEGLIKIIDSKTLLVYISFINVFVLIKLVDLIVAVFIGSKSQSLMDKIIGTYEVYE